MEVTPDMIEAAMGGYPMGFDTPFYASDKENLLKPIIETGILNDYIDSNLLFHIGSLLQMQRSEIQQFLDCKVEVRYREILKYYLNENIDLRAIEEYLSDIRTNLGISEELGKAVYEKVIAQHLQSLVDEAIADERISPEEDAKMQSLISRYNIDVKMDEDTRALLERYRTYWNIEQGTLQPLPSTLNLQKNENLYYEFPGVFYEMKTLTRALNYGGITTSVKIMKGVYWRMGHLTGERVTEDVYKMVDTGRVFMTNKRVVFLGSRKSTSIKYNKILHVEPYLNGLKIFKDTGKPLFIETEDLFCAMYISRLLQDSE